MLTFGYTPMPWMEKALCADYHDPDLWFPSESGTRAQLQVRAAKDICTACPVQAECLAVAQADPLLEGIWGGLTKPERSRLKRRTCA